MRISDWSSDVCSSDLVPGELASKYPVQSCKAAIAVIMGRDPKTMNGRKLGDGMIHVSYRRPDAGKRWAARCEMVGDNQLRRAAFNAFGGRSEERRVGKEVVSSGQSRGAPGT